MSGRRRSRPSRLLGLPLVLALMAVPPAATAAPHAVAGLTFEAPDGAEVTEQEDLPEGVAVVAITYAEEVLLLTTYRGKGAPQANKALATHAELLERGVSEDAPVKSKVVWRRMLGKNREGRRIRYSEGEAWRVAVVLAARVKGVTLVASWAHPDGDLDPTSPVVVKSVELAP